VRCPRDIDLMNSMIALKEYSFDEDINVPARMRLFGDSIVASNCSA
jgi:hypothetical protein